MLDDLQSAGTSNGVGGRKSVEAEEVPFETVRSVCIQKRQNVQSQFASVPIVASRQSRQDRAGLALERGTFCCFWCSNFKRNSTVVT